MHFDVQFLEKCKSQILKQFYVEADSQKGAVMKCNFWMTNYWVRVTKKGEFYGVLYLMKKDGSLEKVF